MARWTLSELMSNATTRAGRRADIDASTVSFWVNEAYQQFASDVYEFLSEKTVSYSVSSGDSQLTLPVTFGEAVSLSEVTTEGSVNRPIKQTSPEYADARGYYPGGQPEEYFIWNNIIQLRPSANSPSSGKTTPRTLLFRYKWIPEELTSGASVPSVATEHRLGILYKSEQFIHEYIGNVEEASVAEVRYLNFVTTLKDATTRRHAARSPMGVRLSNRGPRRRGDLRDQGEWLRR